MSYGGRRGGRGGGRGGGGGGGGRRHGNEEEQSRKLFIGGLSFDTDDDILRDYFGQYGKITDSVVIRDKESGKSKGFGFVTYETEEEADECMGKRPHTLQNRQVDVKRAVSREESSRPGAHVSVKKIFLGGLKEGMKEEDIRSFFEMHGPVETVEVMREKGTDKIRGFGFVTFSDYDAVDKLVAKKHVEISGVVCEVKKALSRAEMDKAKADAEMKAQKSGGYDSYGNGGGGGYRGYDSYGGGRGGGGYDGYGGRYGGGGAYGDGGYGDRDGYGYDGNGYGGGYNDGYGRGAYGGGGGGGGGYGSGGYGQDSYGGGGGGGYGSGYGGGPSSYGPMKGGQYSQRSSGPYGSGYGAGSGGGGYGQGGSGYGGGGGQGGYGGGSRGGGYGGGNYGGGRY